MRSRQLYLHVGTHRTGSSALQTFFYMNRSRLQQQGGLVYPLAGLDEQRGHTDTALFFSKKQVPRKVPFRRADFIREIEASAQDRFLLSSEYFLGCSPAQVEAIRRFFAPHFSSIRIVFYLRRQDRFLESFYCQMVKLPLAVKVHCSIQEFMKQPLYVLDYRRILKRFSDVFGADNLLVRPYEKGQLQGGSLFADCLQTLGVDGADDYAVPETVVNPSLTRDALEYKRRLNQLPMTGEQMGCFSDPLSRFSLEDQPRQAFEPQSLLSPAERTELLACFSQMNREIARRFLGRRDGRLFYDTPAAADDSWQPYPGLSEAAIVRINRFLKQYDLRLYETLQHAILNGLKSEDRTVQSAARQLSLCG